MPSSKGLLKKSFPTVYRFTVCFSIVWNTYKSASIGALCPPLTCSNNLHYFSISKLQLIVSGKGFDNVG